MVWPHIKKGKSNIVKNACEWSPQRLNRYGNRHKRTWHNTFRLEAGVKSWIWQRTKSTGMILSRPSTSQRSNRTTTTTLLLYIDQAIHTCSPATLNV